jgi:pimeloyl-ACP methyl ester carboxylesterase
MRYWAAVAVLVLVVSGGIVLGIRHRSQQNDKRPPRSDGDISRFQRSSERKGVIVFVHGIFGDSRSTWLCDRGRTWPEMLLVDSAFCQYDIYVAAYDTPYFGNTMTVDEVVANMKNRFGHDELLTKYDNVVFVCHSLGGIIVQRLLLTYREWAPKVQFIYFFSTPDTGAEVARLASYFNADPLLKQLLPGDENDYLLNLESEWRAARFTNIHRYCAYEKKAMGSFLVVDRLSGTRDCESAVPINEDHAGIVKPCSPTDDSYVALKNAVVVANKAPTRACSHY